MNKQTVKGGTNPAAKFQASLEATASELFRLMAEPSDDLLGRQALLRDVLSMVFGLLTALVACQRGLLPCTLDASSYLRILQERVNSSLAAEGVWHGPAWHPVRFAPKWLRTTAPERLFRHGIDRVLRSLEEAASSLAPTGDVALNYVATAFEHLYGRTPSPETSDNVLLDSTRRRDNGVFFTPPPVVKFLTQRTLEPILLRSKSQRELLRLRILDPAAGTGSFLLESLRQLGDRVSHLRVPLGELTLLEARRLVATSCLYGVDIDPLATEVAKALIWIEVGDPGLPMTALDLHIRCGDSLLGEPISTSERRASPVSEDEEGEADQHPQQTGFFCWQDEFPDVFFDNSGRPREDAGFDAILCNPPWGIIKPTLREFYAHLDARVSNYQGVELRQFLEVDGTSMRVRFIQHCWDQYASELRAYAKRLRDSHAYQAQSVRVSGRATGGDADLYKYFMERCFHLLNPRGRAGLIVPASFERSEGATGLRRLFLKNGTFEDFLQFQNRKRLFPIHSMFRFTLLVYQRGSPDGIQRAYFGLVDVEEAERLLSQNSAAHVKLSPHFLSRVGGPLVCIPEVRTDAERVLLKKVHMLHPRLREIQNHGWNVRFVREVDMTNDNSAFRDVANLFELGYQSNNGGPLTSPCAETYLPVFEGRMVHQFDYAAKAYRRGQGRTAEWEPLLFTEKVVMPHYFVGESYVARRGSHRKLRAGFRDITGHANERTALAALIPDQSICGNKVPTCEFDVNDTRVDLIWIAIANSFVIDWIVRRRISTTLNYFQWAQVPFPRVDPDSDVGKELYALAAGLAHLDLRSYDSAECPRWEEDSSIMRERAQARAEIDTIVAGLFELSAEEFALVLSDFPLLDRWQPALPLRGDEESQANRRIEVQSTATRDVALLQLFRRAGSGPPYDVQDIFCIPKDGWIDLERRVAFANEVGAIAYVPSELAAKRRQLCVATS